MDTKNPETHEKKLQGDNNHDGKTKTAIDDLLENKWKSIWQSKVHEGLIKKQIY